MAVDGSVVRHSFVHFRGVENLDDRFNALNQPRALMALAALLACTWLTPAGHGLGRML